MLRQWKAMHEQLEQMESAGKQTDALIKHAEGQVAALNVAAKAAKKSADAANLSAKIAAGVSVPTLVVEKFSSGDTGAANLEAFLQYPSIKLVVKNHGQTPAFLRSWSVIFTCDGLPSVPVYYGAEPGCGIVLEKEVVPANEPYPLPDLHHWQRQKFSDEDIRAIIHRKKTLCVYGCINYWDVFGTSMRQLKFCETAFDFWDGPPAGIRWFGDSAPAAYKGTDVFPLEGTTWKDVGSQPTQTHGKAEDYPEDAN